ncbi:ATP-binding cassette domain-containing protein [Desulfobacula sp.]|uniref:ATP-binding cassette domain-containing protein n=1 Tax=Desulfobacula sp. TaxID=2593537 RepID=UPI00262E910D|nr:ATP-binding cassette domain-containing protein [Desulfobacula sp.]
MQLECKHLNFTYPGSDVAVINNLSFSMKNPGFNALFGPSGVGKTSLAKLIARGNARYDGDIMWDDMETILYTYNLERLPGWSSTGGHLSKVTPPGKEGLKEHLVQVFELTDVLGSRFSQLSMGQQNRINLIRYLLQEFDLLILDESLANVDEKLRETIILAIKDLFADKMFLYISHNLMEVSKFCRQILVFGKPSENKGCFMISGQDYQNKYHLDKKKLDLTMLEIMNAF